MLAPQLYYTAPMGPRFIKHIRNPWLLACTLLCACSVSSTISNVDIGGTTLTPSTLNLLADGEDSALVTLVARRGNGAPIAGIAAVLVAPQCIIHQPSQPTDAAGATYGRITSTLPGLQTIAAQLLIDGTAIAVNAAAQINFFPASSAGLTVAGDATSMQVSVVSQAQTVTTAHFTSSDPRAQLPADYAFSAADAGGKIFDTVVLITAGSQTVTALDTGTGLVLAQKVFQVVAANASRLSVTSRTAIPQAGDALLLTVRALDAYGNIATTYRGTVALSSTDAQATLPTLPPFDSTAAGQMTLSGIRLITAGAQQINVSDAEQGALQGTFACTVRAASVAALELRTATAVSAGTAQDLQLIAHDPYGNIATTYTGTAQLSATDASALQLSMVTFADSDAGSVTLPAALMWRHAGAQSISAQDVDAAVIAGQQGGIAVGPGPMHGFNIAGPNQVVAGTYATLTIVAVDSFGNVASDYTGTVHFSSSDVTALLPTAYVFAAADANGVVLAPILHTAGAQSVGVFDTTTPTLQGSLPIAVSHAAAATFVWSQLPSTWTAGDVGSPVLAATDAYGNVVTDFAHTVHVTCSDRAAALPADTAFTPADAGVVQFTTGLMFATAGVQTLTATDVQDSAVATPAAHIAVSGGAPTQLVFAVPPDAVQTTCAALTPPMQVAARDAFNNAVVPQGDVTLTLMQGAAGAVLSGGMPQVYDANGRTTFASVSVSAAQASMHLVATASDANVRAAVSPAFNVSDAPPIIVSGPTLHNSSGCVQVNYSVRSACPVTVQLDVDADGTGTYQPALQVGDANAVGTRLVGGSLTAAPLTFVWDATRTLPHQRTMRATLRLTAVTAAGQSATAVASSLTLDNGMQLLPPASYAAPANVVALTAVDVNHDAAIDLVVLTQDGAVQIYLGAANHSGQFAAAASFAGAAGAIALAAADVNRDGNIDVGVLTPTAAVLLLGNGHGQLAAPTATTAIGSGAQALTWVDMDQNGTLDMLVRCRGNVTWSLQSATGVFQAAHSVAVCANATDFVVADVNSDSKADVVLACSSGVDTLLGGVSGFTAGPSTAVAGSVTALATADVNGDSQADIAAVAGSTVTILLGQGTGAFTVGASVTPGGTWNQVALTDADTDGNPDLWLTDASQSGVAYVRGDANGLFASAALSFAASAGVTLLSGADLNADGAPDLISAGPAAHVEVLLNHRPAACQWRLRAPGAYPVPLLPSQVTVGDLDEDGKPDAIVVGRSSNAVYLLRGRGNGDFVPFGAGVSVGRGPAAMAVADINGDLHLDVLTANANDATLTVFAGDGHGTLGMGVAYDAPLGPNGIAVGDFTSDGQPDVLLAAADAACLALMVNAGGSFLPARVVPLTFAPQTLTVGDVNNDGALDALVTQATAGTGTVLLGDGTGHLIALASTVPLCPSASLAVSLLLADVDKNGVPDVAVACNNGSVYIFAGTGDGTFAPLSSYVSVLPAAVAAADVNRDGSIDLVTAGDGRMTVAVNDGRGTFTPHIFAVQLASQGVATDDVDGDGFADILTVHAGDTTTSNSLVSSLNDGTGAYTLPTPTVQSTAFAFYMTQLGVADINHDGRLDVVGSGYNVVNAFLGDGTGGFALFNQSYPGFTASAAVLGDVNKDSWPDLILGNAPQSQVYLNAQNGGAFNAPNPVTVGDGAIVMADINRDGATDLAAAGPGNGLFYVFGDGTGNFASNATTVGGGWANLAVGDLNNDGSLDFVADVYTTLCAFLNSASGTVSNNGVCSSSYNSSYSNIVLTDFDRDGKLDAALNTFSFMVSNMGAGNGTFVNPTVLPLSGLSYPFNFASADMNGDGAPDLITMAGDSTLAVLLGDGAGGFAPVRYFIADGNPFAVATGDFNRDGLIDVATIDGVAGSAAGNGSGGLLVRLGQ